MKEQYLEKREPEWYKLPLGKEVAHYDYVESCDLIFHEPCLDCNSEEERWQSSLMYFAGAMRAFWSREFGKWDQFAVASDLITLVEQAAASWRQLLISLKRRAAEHGEWRDDDRDRTAV
jgi:hypothetical protein